MSSPGSNSVASSTSDKYSSICRFGRNFHESQSSKSQAKSRQVRLWHYKGKVLGCLVWTKGVEANPDKIKALVEMQEPISVKGVQKLIGRVTALNRFIPRAAERSLPFFQVLRSSKNFQWSESQKKAFQELKDYLSNMTKLCSLEPKSPLLYLSSSNSAMSTVLVQEKEEKGKIETNSSIFRFGSSFRIQTFLL
jgi:hypothetical protein